MQFLLDTDICIYALNRPSENLVRQFNAHAHQFCISVITEYELLFGAQKSTQREENLQKLQRFTARLDVLEFGTQAADHAGRIRAELERKGTPIGPYDVLIAGHARSEGLTLVTNNQREFGRVPGLATEKWR